MNGDLGRIDGGAGIAIKKPCVELSAEISEDMNLPDKRLEEACSRVLKHYRIKGGARLDFQNIPQSHVGLGSRTQMTLAASAAITRLYGIKASVRELAFIAGRGGTSGIGVCAFERGGFIVDGGHPKSAKPRFLPSSFSKAEPPPVLARYDFPDWPVTCIIPKLPAVEGLKEKSIFDEYCPINKREVETLSRLVLMRLMPAVLEKDIDGFGDAINQMQNMAFKRIETSLRGDTILELLCFLQKNSRGAGMSSFGPLCYSFSKNKAEAKKLEKHLRDYASRNFDKYVLFTTKADNDGAKSTTKAHNDGTETKKR